MKQILRVAVLLAAVVVFAAACGGDDGAIEVQGARYRLATADLGAGYMTITNSTSDDVTLEAASAEGIGHIELHESFATDDGAMSMQELSDGIAIAAGETVTLEPGGLHLMLFDPQGTDDLTLMLEFGDETIEVLTPFDAAASASLDMDMGGDSMDDMDSRDG